MGFGLLGLRVAELGLHFCLSSIVFLQNLRLSGLGLRGLQLLEEGFHFCGSFLIFLHN